MVILILVIGLVLRLINLNQSLWLDEAINVVAAKSLPLKDLVTNYSLGDFHPPLYHPILWTWIRIFGSSEVSVRMPSVIFGCLTIYFTYLLAKNLFNRKLALISSFFMAIAPYHIYFSQEARMYCLEGLLGTAALFYFFKIIRKDKQKFWIGYTIFITLAIYVDYFGFFVPLVPFIYLISQGKKTARLWKNFTYSSLFSAVAWLAWLPLFLKQLNNALLTAKGLPGWANVVGSATLKNLALTFVKFSLGRISFDNKFLYGFISLTVFAIFSFLIALGLKYSSCKDKKYLLLWATIPLMVSFFVSLVIPIYQPFRLLYLLPVLYILPSLGILALKPTWQKMLTGALVFFICIGGLLIYYQNPRFHREDWRTAIKTLEDQAGTEDLVVFVSDKPMSPWVYYQRKNLQAIGTGDIDRIGESDRIYLFRYLWPVFDPEDRIRQLIEKQYTLLDVKEFNGIEWQLFKRISKKS